ncbi:MAG: glucan biosynthesis glucosyltransferase H, partial [Herbaspirillum sp.]
SAPLWFLFLALSTGMLAVQTLVPPHYFTQPFQLFPIWPEWHPEQAIALFSATATLLFLPKFLSALLIVLQGAQQFGGSIRLSISMLLELIFSMLLAPVRMLFHTRFVLAALLGWAINWKSPPRDDAETGWREAWHKHGWHTLLGLIWGAGIFWLSPDFLWWLLPIVGALALSIPLSVLSSRVALGRCLRHWKLFIISEEIMPPVELRAAENYLATTPPTPGLIQAIVDPRLNALLCASATARPNLPAPTHAHHAQLVQRALRGGTAALSNTEALLLLQDPLALASLHHAVWRRVDTHIDWLTLTQINPIPSISTPKPASTKAPITRLLPSHITV